MGLDKKMKMYLVLGEHRVDRARSDIQGVAEGVYFFENFPRMLKAKDDQFHKEFIKRVGIDDEHAREIGGTRVMDKSHGWQAWEDIFAIKQAIETSGYKTRKDVEGAIQALEGMQMKNSLAPPAGRQVYPQRRPRRHNRLLHQPRGKRKTRSQKANSERRTRKEHAAAARLVSDAGLTTSPWRRCMPHRRHLTFQAGIE